MGRFRWALVLAVVLLLPCIAFAVPQLINYQGKLSNGSGNPVNGDYSITFTIYNAPTNGDVLWAETQTVTVTDGVFNVLLGSQNSILANTFDGDDRYLGVKVDTDAEMTPRQQLASVPYALSADSALVAETCTTPACVPGDEVVCYTGDPATKGVAACVSGIRTCGQDGRFGACVGEVTPVAELCTDQLDNDCDGQVNNGCLQYIFVTSVSYLGDFGWIGNGDSICQYHGDTGSSTAFFGATWTAILSDDYTNANERFTIFGPVFNTHGDLVVNNEQDLWDGTLANAVGYDEDGDAVSGFVWTGTDFPGTHSYSTCHGWVDPYTSGIVGNSASTDSSWVYSVDVSCSDSYHLYCISSSIKP